MVALVYGSLGPPIRGTEEREMVLITWTRRPRPDGNGAIKVLLVDDHRMVRKGFRSIIEEQPDIRVVGEAANGIEAAEKTRIMRPVAVIMDINMPVMNGLEATRSIHREMSDVAVVGLSLHSQDDVFWRRRCLIL